MLHQSDQLNPLLSLYIQDNVQNGEPRDYTRLQRANGGLVPQNIREACLRGRQLGNPASGTAAAKSKSQGNGKRNIGECIQCTTKGHCSRGEVWNEIRPRAET